jgi:hypothetical protein
MAGTPGANSKALENPRSADGGASPVLYRSGWGQDLRRIENPLRVKEGCRV